MTSAERKEVFRKTRELLLDVNIRLVELEELMGAISPEQALRKIEELRAISTPGDEQRTLPE